MSNKVSFYFGNHFLSAAPFDDGDDFDDDFDDDFGNDDFDDDFSDDDFDDDKLTEESYRTTFDTNPEELEIQAEEVGEEDDF